jgi:SAM-dependent methyltransferase
MIAEGLHYWETVGAEWRATHRDALWRAHSDAVNGALLAAWLPVQPVGRLLKTDLFDEAVGEGLYAPMIARARCVIGIDLSPSTVQAARPRTSGQPSACADVRRLPFAGETYDVVISNSTLDHFHTLDELAASLRELHRVLRREGVLLLTMDNPVNPLIALRNVLPFRWLYRLGIVPYFVGVTCGPRRLRRMLEQTGFEVVAEGAVMHCLRVLAVPVCRALQRRGRPHAQQRLLRLLMACEKLSAGPLRFVTGNFIAMQAIKR